MRKFEDLQRQLSEGRLSRREFVKRATVLGMAAAIPSGLLMENAQAAKRGGRLRMGFHGGSTTDSMDTQALTSEFSNMMFYTLLGHLTEVAPNGKLVPQLAESYEPNATADEWTFDLRKGVEFHNGKTMDADDVMMSVDNHRGENSKSQVKAFVDQIVSMRKDGPNRVIFSLKEGNADFPFLLSSGALGILPVKDGKLEFGVGTGAYSIDRFDPGVSADLKRFPNHFRDNVGFFDSANILVVADSTSRQNALVTGEVDYIDYVPPQTAKLLARKPGIEVLEVAGTLHYTFPMRVDTAPYDNNDVRLAMKYAFDREDALKRILHGYGSLGNDHPISPANRYYNKDLPQRVYDPDKAKFHLKKSGVTEAKFELTGSEGLYAGCMDTILLYKEYAAKAGIDITPNRAPNDGYWSDVWMVHPWSASIWSGRPTEDWMFSQGYGATSNWNETYWKHPKFNKLLVLARAELDDAKRREMYGEMQSLCRDDGGSVIPLFGSHISANSEKIGVPKVVAGNWETDGYKMIERWWFK
jgi:peptide/nickel transport system substrate-binding protein